MGFLNDHFPEANAQANSLYRFLRVYFQNRTSRAAEQVINHIFRRIRGLPAPVYVQIGITYRCQCRCIHCYAKSPRDESDKELCLEEIKSVLDQSKRLGVLQVIFTGGEPLLREDLEELVKHAHKAGLITRINSNGLLLDKERVLSLKKAGLTQLHVSIDDADRESHDQLRGLPGIQVAAIEGIKNLRRAGILCQIITCAYRKSVPEGLKKIISLGKDLGTMCVYIVFPVASGRYDGEPEHLLTEREKRQVRRLQNPTFVHLELPTPNTRCSVSAKTAFYVSPWGDVTPCPPVPYALGNIRQFSVIDLWHRHCDSFKLECRGDCPMNSSPFRQAIEKHVRTIAPKSAAGRRAEA
jgi:MoaA/NifB/PqqE/SkfB family radical SAM enzyme